MNLHDETPDSVMEKLIKSPPPESAAATFDIDFTLGYKGKYFAISWNVPSPGEYDWLGLYNSSTADRKDYADYQWVKGKASPYVTKVEANPSYYVRYYCWDSSNRVYRRLASAGPFPDLQVSSEHNVPKGRSITDAEFISLQKVFPKLDRNYVKVTGEYTYVYNCIAWSLGFDDRWINPGNNRDDFIAQYISFGCEPVSYYSDRAKIDAWIGASGNGAHGSRFDPSRNLSESKCGPNLRITHGRSDLESTSYGRIFQSFTAPYVFAVTLSFVFTDGDRDKMAQAAAGVFGETRQEFERLFAVWKANWFAGELVYSSDTRDLVKAEDYKELLAMGEDIIPLVIEKLNEEENFPALILYDDLQKDENLVVKYAKNDPPHILMEGEQTRARRTVKLWLNNVK